MGTTQGRPLRPSVSPSRASRDQAKGQRQTSPVRWLVGRVSDIQSLGPHLLQDGVRFLGGHIGDAAMDPAVRRSAQAIVVILGKDDVLWLAMLGDLDGAALRGF